MRKQTLGTVRDMIGLAILLAVTMPFAFRQHAVEQQASALRVTFLDVGKGDAAVIETPSGKVIVIDTGGKLADGADHGRAERGRSSPFCAAMAGSRSRFCC